MALDLVVANGSVIDGTGASRFPADVGIRGDRIAVVSRAGGLRGGRVIDATGLAVAPGFIDIDTHADWSVATESAAAVLGRWVRQGVTTVIGGACGFSPAPIVRGGEEIVARLGAFLCDRALRARPESFGEFLDRIAGRALPLNVGFLVGQNTVRAQTVGASASPPPDAVRRMLEATREALRAGAFGVSANAGFVPGVCADAAELAALAGLAARQGALFAVHARAYTRVSPNYPPTSRGGPHNVRAIADLVEIARRTDARLHVLHLMVAGRRTWRTCAEVLRCIDGAKAAGVDIAFDAAPYPVAVGPLQLLFPSWFVAAFPEGVRARHVRVLKLLAVAQRALLGIGHDDVRLRCAGEDPALTALEGCSFAEVGRRLSMHAIDAEVDVARRVGMNGASVLVATASGTDDDDGPLRAILSHPLCAIATNAASSERGPQNPSATGAFPRMLGRYVREAGLVPLEEAIRRMTSLPAERLGLSELGRIAAGRAADLTLFDPDRVADAPMPERADAVPTGIRTVIVSGVPVLNEGVVARELPGRVLRRPRSA